MNLQNTRNLHQTGGAKKGQKNNKLQYNYDLSCYNDADNAQMNFKDNAGGGKVSNYSKVGIIKKNNSESMPHSAVTSNVMQGTQ